MFGPVHLQQRATHDRAHDHLVDLGRERLRIRQHLLCGVVPQHRHIGGLDVGRRRLDEGVAEHHRTAFTGFGKFSAAARAARQGVNPRTGERVQIAATTVPKFSAGSQLKAALKS